MENILMTELKKNQEIAENLKPRYKVGDTVRVLKSLDDNVYTVIHFLGKKCLVGFWTM